MKWAWSVACSMFGNLQGSHVATRTNSSSATQRNTTSSMHSSNTAKVPPNSRLWTMPNAVCLSKVLSSPMTPDVVSLLQEFSPEMHTDTKKKTNCSLPRKVLTLNNTCTVVKSYVGDLKKIVRSARKRNSEAICSASHGSEHCTHAMARALVAVTDDNCRMETVGDPPGRSMFYKKHWRTVARGLQMSPQVLLFILFITRS